MNIIKAVVIGVSVNGNGGKSITIGYKKDGVDTFVSGLLVGNAKEDTVVNCELKEMNGKDGKDNWYLITVISSKFTDLMASL